MQIPCIRLGQKPYVIQIHTDPNKKITEGDIIKY